MGIALPSSPGLGLASSFLGYRLLIINQKCSHFLKQKNKYKLSTARRAPLSCAVGNRTWSRKLFKSSLLQGPCFLCHHRALGTLPHGLVSLLPSASAGNREGCPEQCLGVAGPGWGHHSSHPLPHAWGAHAPCPGPRGCAHTPSLCARRRPHAGRRRHRRGGGQVSGHQARLRGHLQRELGAGRRREDGGRAGPPGQAGLRARR